MEDRGYADGVTEGARVLLPVLDCSGVLGVLARRLIDGYVLIAELTFSIADLELPARVPWL
jgi:hypothetical protein